MNLYHRLSQCSKRLWQPVSCSPHGSRRCHPCRRIPDDTSQPSDQLGTAIKCLADAVRNCVLRDQAHGNSLEPFRPGKVRSGSISIQSKTSGFDDCCGQSISKDDACIATYLHADDRTQVGGFHGCLRFNWGCIRHVCSCARRRSVHACRRVCSWMSSTARDAHRGRDGNSANHRRGQHPPRHRRQQVAHGAYALAFRTSRDATSRYDNQQNEIGCITTRKRVLSISATNTLRELNG